MRLTPEDEDACAFKGAHVGELGEDEEPEDVDRLLGTGPWGLSFNEKGEKTVERCEDGRVRALVGCWRASCLR